MDHNTFKKLKKYFESTIEKLKDKEEIILQQLDEENCICTAEIENIKTGKKYIYRPDQEKRKTKKKLKEKYYEYLAIKEINRVKNELKRELKTIQRTIKHLKELSKNITYSGLNSHVENIVEFILEIMVLGDLIELDLNDFKQLLSLCIRKNYEYYNNNQKALRELKKSEDLLLIDEMEICSVLGPYFDKKGGIIPHKNEEIFRKNIYKLFETRSKTIDEINKRFKKEDIITTSEIINSLCEELNTKNEIQKIQDQKRQQQKEHKIIRAKEIEQEMKTQTLEFKKQKEAQNELAEYYYEGQIIKPHPNNEEFENLLKKCGYQNEKITKIKRLMGNYLLASEKENKKQLLKRYLTSEEIKILEIAQSHNKENTIYFLEEINEIINLLNNTTDEDEINILKEYLRENFTNLKYSLNISSEEINKLLLVM